MNNMATPNKIIWNKWVDPFRRLMEEEETAPFIEEDEDDADFISAHDSFTEEQMQKRLMGPKPERTGPIIIGPFGAIPIQEHNLPGVLYNFWMGHTNFDITKQVKNTIEKVPGVETLDVFTRYRFRIGVGKAFNDKAVTLAISEAVKPPEIVVKQKESYAALRNLLKNKYKFWAIYVMKDGKTTMAGGNSVEDVKLKSKGYEENAKEIICSWEID